MAKRMTKTEIKGIILLVILGLPIYGFLKLGESVGWVSLAVGAIAIVILVIWYQSTQTKKRRDALMYKYGDKELVDALMSKSFWQGQTAGQLTDSLGEPHDIDQKVLKTKKKEIWKYDHQGGNRYGLRITLDNDEVVGWDQKT